MSIDSASWGLGGRGQTCLFPLLSIDAGRLGKLIIIIICILYFAMPRRSAPLSSISFQCWEEKEKLGEEVGGRRVEGGWKAGGNQKPAEMEIRNNGKSASCVELLIISETAMGGVFEGRGLLRLGGDPPQ